MLRMRIRRLTLTCTLVALCAAEPARADEGRRPPEAAIGHPAGLHPVAPRDAGRRGVEPSGSASGWWIGTVGLALALAAVGGLSLASRHMLPQNSGGDLKVVGRVSLTSRQSVHLVR